MDLPNVTICVTTFERPHCLDRLLASVRARYPDVPVVVADWGERRPAREVAERHGAEYHRLPFDCGMCVGRNYLYRQAKTEFLFQTDDDMELTDNSRLQIMPRMMRQAGADVLGCGHVQGGRPIVYYGRLFVRERVMYRVVRGGATIVRHVYETDMTTTLFMARTERVKLVQWDERLKWGELWEWFWRAKGVLRVCFTDLVWLAHKPWSDAYYETFRARYKEHTDAANDKMGIVSRAALPRPGPERAR